MVRSNNKPRKVLWRLYYTRTGSKSRKLHTVVSFDFFVFRILFSFSQTLFFHGLFDIKYFNSFLYTYFFIFFIGGERHGESYNYENHHYGILEG